MKHLRSWFLFAFLNLIIVGQSPAYDFFCANALDPIDRAGYPPDSEFEEIPESYFSTCFNDVFTIKVHWDDWNNPNNAFWPLDSIQAFAEKILPAECTPDSAWAERIAQYIGEDIEPTFPRIRFQWETKHGVVVDRDNFTLWLLEGSWWNEELKIWEDDPGSLAQPHTGRIYLSLHNDPETTVWELAHYGGFAHEWGHIAHYSTEPWLVDDVGCRHWGEAGYPGGPSTAPASAGEFVAHSSEFFCGKHFSDPNNDKHYRSGLGAHGWRQECWEWNISGRTNRRSWVFEPLIAYVTQRLNFDLGDLQDDGLSRWYHEECWAEGPAKYDFDSFAEVLYSLLGGSFDEATGDGRLQELFREYVLALWVNSGHLMGDVSIFMPEDEGSSIRDNFHFFHDTEEDGAWGCDDAFVLPYYAEVSNSWVTEEGPITWDRVGSSCTDPSADYELRKELLFEALGFEVLPFYGDESILASGECYDLQVEIELEEFCDCEAEGPSFDWTPNGNELLHFWVLGYPNHTENLDMQGETAVLIDSIFVPQPDIGTVVEVEVPCFGARFKSVVLLTSLTEIDAAEGALWSQSIPFKYRYRAVPSSLDLSVDVTLPTNTKFLCVDEWKTVPYGVTATILPGTEVWFADPDVVGNDVGFNVEGTLVVGDAAGGRTEMVPVTSSTEWDGVTVVLGGQLDIENTDIQGVKEVEAFPGMCGWVGDFAFNDINLTFANDANGLLLDKANTVTLDDVILSNTPFVTLRNANFLNSKVYMEQDPSGVAVEVVGTSTLDNVVIYDAYTALKVPDGNVTLHNVSAEAGQWAGLTLKLGLLASEAGVVDAENCTLLGFNRGIVAEDDAQITLRTSEVKGTACGVYAIGNTQVDLGDTPTGEEGDNCIDGSTYKVCNLSSYSVPARLNYWYEQNPDPSDFYGSVDYWQEYHTECPTGAGGPDFLIAPGGSTQVSGLSAFPNPFNPSCTIKFILPTVDVSCELAIFDIAGRRVATLFEGEGDGRQHEIEWSGRMDSGGQAGSGVYLLSLRTGSKVENAKLVLVH
jgi:hypothetical protein